MHVSSRQLADEAVTRLSQAYDPAEARSIAFLLLEHLYGLSKAAVIADKTIPQADQGQWQENLRRLEAHEPLQYVTGTAHFYGLRFGVNPAVLIPRPETEELVDWIIREHRNRPVRILDIGTGSGCIAVSLAKNLPQAQVWGADISADALRMARQNAHFNEANVQFVEADILHWETAMGFKELTFDLVVSNPPYVTTSEQNLMRPNVLAFEPHLALFVPDADPLLFYRCIAAFCKRHLTPGGVAYLEINEQFPAQMAEVLQAAGLQDPFLFTDLSGKPRHIRAFREKGPPAKI
jgi:release factor glutamine methyltransferase